jgi:hypothetical protein
MAFGTVSVKATVVKVNESGSYDVRFARSGRVRTLVAMRGQVLPELRCGDVVQVVRRTNDPFVYLPGHVLTSMQVKPSH